MECGKTDYKTDTDDFITITENQKGITVKRGNHGEQTMTYIKPYSLEEIKRLSELQRTAAKQKEEARLSAEPVCR